jgi:ribosome recycling factor
MEIMRPFRSASLLIQSLYVKQQSTMYDFSTFKKDLTQAVEHYKAEISSIRTGRAAPALLDGVRVESYGSIVPLNQVGGVTIEDARTLRVSAWDQSQVKAIERGIHDADLGVSLSTDEKGVRVSFPELTSERREQLMRLTRTKLEEARTAVRIARDEVWQDIQKKEKEKEISEDEKFTAKENMEKQVKETNESLEKMAKKKEEELNS